jgi:hypothetical protein
LLLATACVGGQSGDPGTVIDDDPFGTREATSAAAPHCEGARMPDDDAGVDDADVATCDAVDGGGFDCECGDQSGTSDAITCIDALRERCGVEPPEPDPPSCIELEREGGAVECIAQDPEGP